MSTRSEVTRRGFMAALPAVALGLARAAGAQETAPVQGGAAVAQGAEVAGASMEGDGYIPVRLAPKANATPSMAPDQRDAVERQIACPCPCTLDVFTCRTSMPCGFSPRMHADVIALVEGGYSGEEILDAFKAAYGQKVLMAPEPEGFNLFGYLAPFLAIGGGGLVLAMVLRRWRAEPAVSTQVAGSVGDATADELARLDAAVRGEDDRR